ncbi:39s ribosomal protein l18 mitochondrial [Holotrichia oblita]|uniref:39s ribosomal protein l18 mitochondrial n=1 Tax=Holotrichia oblita TaxID=644536 RepID=A0ACB9SQX2_HOLOL|nr:39s ribosomal protein l18 mitochondrial [Holotrichia oblita]
MLKPTILLKPEYSNIKFLCRNISKNDAISPILTNRNPRNLEKLRIGYKPDGYHLENKGRSFWHKLKLTISGRYISASIQHFENGKVIRASTNEWALRKQLYSSTDYSAYTNLARVFAQRCLQMGIIEVRSDVEPSNPDGKIAAFLKTLEENGLTLTEPPQFKPAQPWDLQREEKPWEVST